MKCSRCGIDGANILIKQIINGKESELSLCGDCAKDLGILMGDSGAFNFANANALTGNLFSAFQMINNAANVNTGVFVPMKSEKKCEHCNTTLTEFREGGKLGCIKCYDSFAPQLNQVFRRIQSGEVHLGRKLAQEPGNFEIRNVEDEIDKIQEKIKKAVAVEDYKLAAELKTTIEKLKEKIKDMKAIDEKGGGSV